MGSSADHGCREPRRAVRTRGKPSARSSPGSWQTNSDPRHKRLQNNRLRLQSSVPTPVAIELGTQISASDSLSASRTAVQLSSIEVAPPRFEPGQLLGLVQIARISGSTPPRVGRLSGVGTPSRCHQIDAQLFVIMRFSSVTYGCPPSWDPISRAREVQQGQRHSLARNDTYC